MSKGHYLLYASISSSLKWDNNFAYFKGSLWGWHKLSHIRHIQQCLAHWNYKSACKIKAILFVIIYSSWQVQSWTFSCLLRVGEVASPICPLRSQLLRRCQFTSRSTSSIQNDKRSVVEIEAQQGKSVFLRNTPAGRTGTIDGKVDTPPNSVRPSLPTLCTMLRSSTQLLSSLIGIIIIRVKPTSPSDCEDSPSPCLWKEPIVKYSGLIAVSLKVMFICKVGFSPFIFNRKTQTSFFSPFLNPENQAFELLSLNMPD